MLHRIKLYLFICISIFTSEVMASAKAHLSQFDLEMWQLIAQKANVSLNYGMYGQDVSWHELLDRIKEGDVQITGSATVTEPRKQWAQFTLPYRIEEVVLYIPKGKFKTNIKNVSDFIKFVESHKGIKIGVVEGWIQPTTQLNDFVTDPNKSNIFYTGESDFMVTQMLLNKEIDAAILERACAYDSPIANHDSFDEVRMEAITPISFIATKNGKNAVSDNDIAKINTVIQEMSHNGTLKDKFTNFLRMPISDEVSHLFSEK